MNNRRNLNGLSLLFKILKGNGPDYLRDMFTLVSEVTDRNTRTYPGNIWLPNEHHSAIHHKSFRIRIPNLWNNLPEDIKKSNTIICFKKKLKTALLTEQITLP